MDSHALEKLEILDGTRNRKAPRRAAVRIEDIAALLEIPPTLRCAKAAGATPTAAEHDALVQDVTDIHNRLLAIHDALQKRVIP